MTQATVSCCADCVHVYSIVNLMLRSGSEVCLFKTCLHLKLRQCPTCMKLMCMTLGIVYYDLKATEFLCSIILQHEEPGRGEE